MTKKSNTEHYAIELDVLDWNSSYGFNAVDRVYKHNDCEYDGYSELLSVSFICKSKDICKGLKLDKETDIELSIHFSKSLGADGRVGGIIKHSKLNILNVYISLPIKSKSDFLTLLSSNKFKSISICTEKLKYNKSHVASFYISTEVPE